MKFHLEIYCIGICLAMLFCYTGASASTGISNDTSCTLIFQTRTIDNKITVKDSTLESHKMALIAIDKGKRKSFSSQTAEMITNMNKVLDAARKLGIQIIFVPSEAQHNDLIIKSKDLISDNARGINKICKQKGITTLLYAGVAPNMCVNGTPPASIIPMKKYGYYCAVIRDLTRPISENSNDAGLTKSASFITPHCTSAEAIEHIEKYISPTISGDQLLIQAGMPPVLEQHTAGPALFNPAAVKAYIPKGPSQSFRQLCYDYNWVGRSLSDIPLKFTRASATAFADLSKSANLDAALVLAVPHHGYTTYDSKYGVKFPGMKGDWFGEVVKALHERNISAIGYITLGTNWKFMRDHIGLPFVHSAMKKDGEMDMRGLCLNAPGYAEMVENYTTEILTGYPIDALRYDMLFSPLKCDCSGCRQFYEEYYGEPFTDWASISAKDSMRAMQFNIATLNRIATRVLARGKAVKPSVEMWQNHVNTDAEADINLGRKFDVAYIEFGSPFRLLALKGILNKDAIIVGQTLKSPIRRMMMALGAHCYQYIKVDQETALPYDREWVENDLSRFYKMVSEVQPYLEKARLITNIGVIFNENTRYHFPKFSRAPYMAASEALTLNYLNSSCPLRFINALDLDKTDLRAYKLLFLPRSSGFTADNLEKLKTYVRLGGQLLITGDALLFDESGKPLTNFALATEMGVNFKQHLTSPGLLSDIHYSGKGKSISYKLPDTTKIAGLTEVTVNKGRSIASIHYGNKAIPLVQVTPYGKGNMIYVANAGDEKLIRSVADLYSGELPVKVSDTSKQVIVTSQEKQQREIIHLLSDGNYEVRIKKNAAPYFHVQYKYPQAGWEYTVREHKDEVIINVSGDAKDRLLVLERNF